LDPRTRSLLPSSIATAVLAVAGLHFAEPVLAPLAAAGILSVVLGGAVQRVERFGFGRVRLGRIASVLVVAVGITAVFAGIGWIVANEGSELTTHLPEYRQTLREKIRGPVDAFDRAMRQIRSRSGSPSEARAHPAELVPTDSELVGFVAGWAGSIVSIGATAGIVVVLLIFLLIEREDLRNRVLRVAGRGDLRTTGSWLGEASERVARYLRALALLNCGHGLAVGVGLALLGVPGALLFGLLAAVLRFVPYAGPLVAACAPLALSAAVFDGWSMVLWVALFLGALELVSNNLVEPWLYGASVGLSPFAVILSAIFWGWLWGPVGLVLATPLTVCVVVMGRQIPGLETISILLSDSVPLHPFERLYERLLARDPESAQALIAELSEEEAPTALWDGTWIPALRLLERDRRSGAIEDEDLALVRATFDGWRLDDAKARSPLAPSPSSGKPVLCIAGEGFADEILSAALAHLLAGCGVPARSPASETVDAAARGNATVLCISALDPSAVSLGPLLRRLRERTPPPRVVVGFWGADAARLRVLRASLGADGNGAELVGTLHEAIARLGGVSRLPSASAVPASG
jgi:predicted PurR-regulated permease PerM